MRSRSAHAAIKGYFYQFDHTIIRLLSATNSEAVVIVEGIEDVDLTDGNDEILVQCKYYEGTEYNHSAIKEAIIQMVRHFHANGSRGSKVQKYRIYGHYNGGHEKLPKPIDVEFIKKHFLTFTKEGVVTQVHVDLNMDDTSLKKFLDRFEVNVSGKSYDEQREEVEKLLISHIKDSDKEDVRIFFYPLATDRVRLLAIGRRESDRSITKRNFIEAVNKKDLVFDLWLRRKFGDEYYERSIKRRYFSWKATKVPKKSRLFLIDLTGEFLIEKVTALIADIGRKLSHVEHRTTPAQDRFCPYIYLRGLTEDNLIELKGSLVRSGIKISDGYGYKGAPFSPDSLTALPTKEQLTQVKFIESPEDICPVISLIRNTQIEVFDFFKESPHDRKFVPHDVVYNTIKIESAFTIQKVI